MARVGIVAVVGVMFAVNPEAGEEQHGALELAIVAPALRLVEAASR